ncbi:hypothetical protein AB0N09_05935 [Streptomyces erythrochromogenes]|uniref:hypothetical protein n=1 Tax=Streptomyces erythrochromogenes TaxID=285574 RepID=UPI00343680A3
MPATFPKSPDNSDISPELPDAWDIAQQTAARLRLHPDWQMWGHPEPFRFEATALGPAPIVVGLHHRYEICGCTASVLPRNGVIDGPFPLNDTVFSPRGPWTVAGKFDQYEHPNHDYEQWGEGAEYDTLADAQRAARALHLEVCTHYQRSAGRCAVCNDPAIDHVTDESRWCTTTSFYFSADGNGPATEGWGAAVNRA